MTTLVPLTASGLLERKSREMVSRAAGGQTSNLRECYAKLRACVDMGDCTCSLSLLAEQPHLASL